MVVAILAILAGLLMPALKSAREKGRAASCMNNLKQIGLAIQMYANENDDAICPYRLPYFPANLASYLRVPPMPSNPPVAGMPDYLRRPNPWLCPSLNYATYLASADGFWDPPGFGSSSSYGCNPVGSNPPYNRGLFAETQYTTDNRSRIRKLSELTAPAEAWLLADSKPQFMNGAWQSRLNISADDQVDRRHAGRAHLLYADGHVGARDAPFPKDTNKDQAFYRFYNGTDGPN